MKAVTQEQKIVVVGAGFMGCSIATIYARHGFAVTVSETDEEQRRTFAHRALPIARSLAADGHAPDEIVGRIKLTPLLDALNLADAIVVHETIQEDFDAKRTLFGFLR